MIEPNNPEITVDELMAKIREEVARRRAANSSPTPQPSSTGAVATGIDWPRLHAGLHAAERYAQVGTFVPNWPRFGRVRRSLARCVARVLLYLSDFITTRQREFNNAVLQSLRALSDGLPHVENRFVEQGKRLDDLEGERDQLRNRVTVLEQSLRGEWQRVEREVADAVGRLEERGRQQEAKLQQVADGMGQWEGRVTGIAQSLRGEWQRVEREVADAVGRLEERGRQQEAKLQQVADGMGQWEGRVTGIAQTLGELRETVERIGQGWQGEQQSLVNELSQREERIRQLERLTTQLKTELILQERRITLLLEEARKRLPEPFSQEQLQVFADEDKHRLDALYVSFEDQFRGTREDIKERLRVYLPFLRDAGVGSAAMPVLDVGCGRGEWLEVLQEERLVARGLDVNRIMVEQCRQRGFDVALGDVLEYLRNLPDASVGAVTGFHIIEHLPLDRFIKLLDETVRVLKPQGLAIFETPNPHNVLVGSCNFYIDPTHRNPLPSQTVKFLAEARGLCRVEILNLHPFPPAFQVNGSAVAERFNEYFYGPRDYAVIGWKV
jgi:O-antigen chain-terminating methyltransferase